MEEIEALREELEKVKKARKDLRERSHRNNRELYKLEKERPLIFGEVALQKRELREKEKLKETIRKLEEENKDIDEITLPWLKKREEELKREIENLEREKGWTERSLEEYEDRKKSYIDAYKEEKEREEREKEGVKYQRTFPTALKIEENKLRDLASRLGKQKDYNEFLERVEKKYVN
ncbi:MAG: hypothetical protein U9R03_03785 [Candidatus Aerophobetes bacterium]|nr:hypothetical protein [Candidatus Aerophobetes bacterium]